MKYKNASLNLLKIFSLPKVIFSVLIIVTLSACSGAPSDRQISNSLEKGLKESFQQGLDQAKLLGGQGAVDQAIKMGMPDPDQVSVTGLSSEDMTKTGNGDFTAKITYTLNSAGKKKLSHARITLTKVDGEWKITSAENL